MLHIIILSLGAINAMIPLLVIVILIGAAAASMRNFSFFNIFGVATLTRIRPSGRSSLARKNPMEGYTSSYSGRTTQYQKLGTIRSFLSNRGAKKIKSTITNAYGKIRNGTGSMVHAARARRFASDVQASAVALAAAGSSAAAVPLIAAGSAITEQNISSAIKQRQNEIDHVLAERKKLGIGQSARYMKEEGKVRMAVQGFKSAKGVKKVGQAAAVMGMAVGNYGHAFASSAEINERTNALRQKERQNIQSYSKLKAQQVKAAHEAFEAGVARRVSEGSSMKDARKAEQEIFKQKYDTIDKEYKNAELGARIRMYRWMEEGHLRHRETGEYVQHPQGNAAEKKAKRLFEAGYVGLNAKIRSASYDPEVSGTYFKRHDQRYADYMEKDKEDPLYTKKLEQEHKRLGDVQQNFENEFNNAHKSLGELNNRFRLTDSSSATAEKAKLSRAEYELKRRKILERLDKASKTYYNTAKKKGLLK
jgi:hypothetical protein